MKDSITSSLYSIDEAPAPSNKLKKGNIFACHECGYIVQIKTIDQEKMEITYYCFKCEKNNKQKTKTISIEDYLRKMSNYSEKFNICSECYKKQDKEEWKFCANCESILCPNCIKIHFIKSKCKCSEENLMNNNERWIKCLNHPKEIDSSNSHYCHTHQEHFCKFCISKPKPKEKEKIHNKKCEREELLFLSIDEEEKQRFKNKTKSLENKKEEILKENEKKKKNLESELKKKNEIAKNKLNEQLEKNKNEKSISINNCHLKKKDEENKIQIDYERELKELNEKIKKLNEKKERDISSLNLKIKAQEKDINLYYENKDKEEKEKYKKHLDKNITNCNSEIKKLKNDANIFKLNELLDLLELIENSYDNYKDNYFNLKNYTFIVNDFNNEETPDIKNNNDNDNNNNGNNDNNNYDYNEKNTNNKGNNNVGNANEKDSNKNLDLEEESKKIENEIKKETLNLNQKENNKNNSIFPKENKQIPNTSKIEEKESINNDNTFTIFELINKSINIIWVDKNNSLIFFDLDKNIRKEIGRKHKEKIIDFRYCYDKKNNKDLIMSLSRKDNNIKIWDINNWNIPLYDLKDFNICGTLNSSCFLADNNNIYIVTCSAKVDSIKIYDLNCNKIKEIKDSNEDISYLDTYYDNNKIFIIAGCKGYIKSYDYSSNKLYKKYYDPASSLKDYIIKVLIYKNEESTNLIDSQFEINFIRIYNFYSGEFTQKIQIEGKCKDICLWNNKYLCFGSDDKTIKFIDIEEGEIIKTMRTEKEISTIKKIQIKNRMCLFYQDISGDIYRCSGIEI